MFHSRLYRRLFLIALLGVALAFGLASFGQQSSFVYDAAYFRTLKARVFSTEPSLEFERYGYQEKGSPCTLFEHGFMTVFRYRGVIYSVAFYCDIPGMLVLAGETHFADRDLDGRVDIVLEGDDALFYDYPLIAKAVIGAERRAEFQYEYDSVFRYLERILPSSV